MIRATVALVLFSSAAAFAQQAAPLEFEVASIKPSDPNDRRMMFRMMPGGAINLHGITLKALVQQAYDVRDFQVSGGPGWIGADKYDITAKTENASPEAPADPRQLSDEQRKTFQEQTRLRLQALLADRFQLKIHRETKELPVYALMVAKNGPKLKENAGANAGPGKGMMRMSPGQAVGQQVGIAFLAQDLAQRLGRTVIDQTGLKGTYDFELNFAPEQGRGGVFGGPGPGDGAPPPPPPPGAGPGLIKEPPPADPNGPTIFTALQEQLGLKLESQKGPVEIIVIDHVEKPSEN
jgi:bla regulator protein blaR1